MKIKIQKKHGKSRIFLSERQDETYIIYAIPFRRWLRARSPYVKPDALDALEVEPLTNDKEAHP